MTSARRSRSMTSGETKPPPLPRTSTISAFLADLREVLLGEFVQAGLTHVGNVDVADFAVGLLGHFVDVLLHPGEVIQGRLVRRRDDRDVARAFDRSAWS